MTDQTDEKYQRAVAAVATRLRRLADDVDRLAQPSYSHGRLDHVTQAMAIQGKVLLELQLLGLNALVWAAMEADHPTARFTPGQLLDRCAAALEGQDVSVGSNVIQMTAPDAERFADAALRGAGLL